MVRGRGAAAAGGRTRPGPSPLPAARPTTAGPSSAAACGFAAAWPGPITSASRRRAWRCRACPAAAGAVRRADRHGRGHGNGRALGRDRAGRGRAGPLPLLQFLGPQGRSARRPAERWTPEELSETDSLEAVLPPDESVDEAYVPVRFHARLTELGVLELWCVSTDQRQTLEAGVQRARRGVRMAD